jgi:Family of unknown function (DUF6527)
VDSVYFPLLVYRAAAALSMNRCKRSDGSILFECPGCGCLHAVSVDAPNVMGAIWSWNGSFELPTFTPSILVTANYTDPKRMGDICHSYVTNGRIQFLCDSTHELAGQTVDLPLWEE